MQGMTVEPVDSSTSTRAPGLPRPSAWVVAVAVVLALLTIWWHGALLDLHIYRLGGQSVRHGGDDLYSLRDAATGLPFTYPPFAALVFAPLAVLAEPVAAVLITLLSVFAAIRLAGLVVEQLEVPARRQSRVTEVVFILLLAGEPVISTILFGQVNLILLALIAQAWLRPGSRWALAGLGVAAGIKLTPAIFILGLFVCGRWRDGIRASLAAATTVAIGAIYLGRSTATFFGGAGFQDTRIGGTNYISNQSLNGMLWRLEGPGGHRLLWLALSMIVLASSMWTARMLHASGQSLLALSVVALAGLVVSPVSWTHHWVVAVPLVAGLTQPALDAWQRSPRPDPPTTGRTLVSRLLLHWRLLLGGAWLVVTSSWVIWMVPRGGDVEYHQKVGDFLLGNAYLELAVVTIVALTVHAVRTRRSLPVGSGSAR